MEDSRPLPYTSRLPWIVSVVVTVVSICFDEPPGPPMYYTGYDPGGAAVVSIVFGLWCGWLTLLAMAGPRWLRLGLVVMVTSSFFGYALHKDNLRRPLYVPNADVIDPLVLWAAAGLIGVASVWLTRGWLRLLTVLISVPLACATSIGFGLAAQSIAHDSWNPGWPFFVMLTACRVLVPYFFWTLILPKNLPGERTGPPNNPRHPLFEVFRNGYSTMTGGSPRTRLSNDRLLRGRWAAGDRGAPVCLPHIPFARDHLIESGFRPRLDRGRLSAPAPPPPNGDSFAGAQSHCG